MSKPKLIRVGGHLYRLREPAPPQFVRFGGYLYRISQTAAERDKVQTSMVKLRQALEAALKSAAPEHQQAAKESLVLVKGAEKALASHRDEDLAKIWEKAGESVLSLVHLSDAFRPIGAAALEADGSLRELQKALQQEEESLVGKEITMKTSPAEVPSPTGPTVDWGEDAPKKQQYASANGEPLPEYIRVSGQLYRLK